MKVLGLLLLLIFNGAAMAQSTDSAHSNLSGSSDRDLCLQKKCPGMKKRIWEEKTKSCKCVGSVVGITKCELNPITNISSCDPSEQMAQCLKKPCPGMKKRDWNQEKQECKCVGNTTGPTETDVELNGCVRTLQHSIECPEGIYKFDKSIMNKPRLEGKELPASTDDSESTPNSGAQ